MMSKFGKYQRAVVWILVLEVPAFLIILFYGALTLNTWINENIQYIAITYFGQLLVILSIVALVTGIAAGMRYPGRYIDDQIAEVVRMYKNPEDESGVLVLRGWVARLWAAFILLVGLGMVGFGVYKLIF